jgi:hypothetical protein
VLDFLPNDYIILRSYNTSYTKTHRTQTKEIHMSFKDLKKNSGDSMKRLLNEAEKLKKGGGESSYEDNRFWKPTLDKSSNGYAVIRFLPPVEGEDLPWVRQFSHGFQGKGGWFIENCPTTIGQKCPVCEANNELWNSGIESDKKIARDRKRKLAYISNILVISDPSAPQNEGKIFLYKYGKKIFEKIEEKMHPQFQDEEAVNPFDFWKGADFKLKVRKVDGYINYDKSEFANSAPLFGGDDAQLEGLWKKQYALKEFTNANEFKGYDELKRKFDSVIGGTVAPNKRAEDLEEEIAAETWSSPSTPQSKSAKEIKRENEEEDFSGDAMSYFERLARGDD